MFFTKLLLPIGLLLLLSLSSLPSPSSAADAFLTADSDEEGYGGKVIGQIASEEDDEDDSSAADASSSSSTEPSTDDDSSASSSSESSEEVGDDSEGNSDETVENVAGWRPAKVKCPKGKFLDTKMAPPNCRLCTMCKFGSYEREQCGEDSDTVCEKCLTEGAQRNANFVAKCAQLIALRNKFHSVLRQRFANDGVQMSKPTIFAVSLESAQNWFKAEFLVEMAFYLALIALVLAVIRFVAKSRPTTYRTVTVTPPVLEEWEQKNIVRAAENIRNKLGKKGYGKLEEEFI